MTVRRGRHFLQLPGPSNVPDRILRAMNRAIIDHRGPEFAEMTLRIMEGLKRVFRTAGPVFIYPSSGSGAWEASLTNTLSPGDRVVLYDSGFFSTKWGRIAADLGLQVEVLPSNWRHAIDPGLLEEHLTHDSAHEVKAVLVVHNETSTGVTNNLVAIREVMDRTAHPALLMADAVSSLASTDLRPDEWGIDVTVSGSQKGLMLPPGLSLVAVSEKALAAHRQGALPRSYWDWSAMLESNSRGFFPYTPATGLLYGLEEAIDMILEEGLEELFARHHRHGEATRRAVAAWGLENFCLDPAAVSSSVTAVKVPEGVDADHLRAIVLERYDMSLGTGLGPLKGEVFRIGHLGDFNDLMLGGTLCGIEMGLRAAGVPHRDGGVEAALDYLVEHPAQ